MITNMTWFGWFFKNLCICIALDKSILSIGRANGIIWSSSRREVSLLDAENTHPDRAPLKEVLGGQYNYREGGGKCCGKALKAAGGIESGSVVRIRAPKK